ncbi:MAG: hypothetical protein ACREGI_01365, partial [Candidatus Levyibacteriota bacterium]
LKRRMYDAGVKSDGRFSETRTSIDRFMGRVILTFHDPTDLMRIFDAIGFMVQVHVGQEMRLEGRQHMDHVLEVSDMLLDIMDRPDPDLVIAGLLHDGIEDRAGAIVRRANGRRSLADGETEGPGHLL